MKKNPTYPRSGSPRTLALSRSQADGDRDGEKSGIFPLLSGALRALPVSLIAGFFLLLLAAGIAYLQKDPNAYLTPLAIGATALSALVGGIVTVRFNRRGALLSGLCGGILYTAVLMILSLCFFRDAGSGYSPAVSLLLHAGVIAMEILGGFLGLPRKKLHIKRRLPR